MSNDSNFINLEILKMAKELVINEYVDKRAELHNQWLVESEHLWKTQRVRVAYPAIPAYPSERDIIVVAKALMDFITVHPKQEMTPVESAVSRVEPIQQESVSTASNTVLDVDQLPLQEEQPKANSGLSRMFQKLEEVKRSLF
jgi:hypothetical protein